MFGEDRGGDSLVFVSVCLSQDELKLEQLRDHLERSEQLSFEMVSCALARIGRHYMHLESSFFLCQGRYSRVFPRSSKPAGQHHNACLQAD